ncbi:metal ABC transporter solute-binding protein, Zn/Mn family [Thalassolituus sp.]|jgi:zinc transport system substrate-binding protein|uniref:metal ABC transporter solute-binding protein, Zn/Mn family n=1 Tax=Thalassolituus sp. TaxID=2030822 RepID=UPI002EB4F72F|nr:zinc ABC transporter substrate-binding protein [Pseudomonadota bacterium]
MFRRFLISALSAALFSLVSVNVTAEDDSPKVLASMHPLGLIAASVVERENLHILLQKGVSPHDFSLRPSDIDHLQEADIIFWGGPHIEPYLSGFARRWPDKVWIDISSFSELAKIKDPHYWMSVPATLAAQKVLADTLGKDSSDFQRRVEAAVEYSDRVLEPVRDRGFFVFHRAYDHWVLERGLNQVGAFTLTPEQKPGMRTVQLMREQLRAGKVACVFREPEYSPALVVTVVGDLPVKHGELDPQGAYADLSRDGYAYFLTEMADRAANCLTP